MPDELAEHLDALKRDDCYRVDAVLKQSPYETTERVFFKGENESELGPFVRKLIDREAGIGSAYESIRAAQRAGRRFRHLPRIIDCYEAGPCLVVVMEHIGGETLADVVYRCDASVALACDVFPRLCDAVAELHEGFPAPIIHRDLKPSNVMLSRDSMTIIDFGIARAYKEESDEDTRRFGTRAYAPPEQFGYGQTDVRSDVYALGMLLYFCLTEKTPDAKTRKDGFRAAEVPEPLRRVIVRATAFDPADRYASAAELKRAFLAAAGMPAPDAPPQIDAPAAYEPPAAAAVGAPSARPLPAVGKRQPWRREPRTAFGRLLARVPFALGVAWDVFLALFFALMCVVATTDIFDPSAGSIQVAGAPVWLRAISYGSLVLLIIGPVVFAVSDRRPLARLVPRLAAVPVERDLAACFVVLLIGVAIFGIAGQFAAAG